MAVKLKKAPDDLQPCVDGWGKRYRPEGAVFTTPDGALALHRMQYLPKQYAVSHVASGYRIACSFETATTAREFLSKLLAAVERTELQWAKLKQGHNADGVTKALLDKIVEESLST